MCICMHTETYIHHIHVCICVCSATCSKTLLREDIGLTATCAHNFVGSRVGLQEGGGFQSLGAGSSACDCKRATCSCS